LPLPPSGGYLHFSLFCKVGYKTTNLRQSFPRESIYDKSEKMIGYDVTYRIGDSAGQIPKGKSPRHAAPTRW
jgi:uncharacterized protein YcfJ